MRDKHDLGKLKQLSRTLGWVFGAAGLFSLFAVLFNIFMAPHRSGPIYLALINVNLFFSLLFVVYVGQRIINLFVERQGRLAGARLHLRLVGIFSFLAVLPAVLVSLFAIVMLNQGIEGWFSTRVTSALDGSLQVAQSYLKEHEQNMLAEARSVENELPDLSGQLLIDEQGVEIRLEQLRTERRLGDIAIYASDGNLLVYAGDLSPPPVTEFQEHMQRNDTPLTQQNLDEQRVVALLPMADGYWLLVSRWIAPSVLARMDETREAYQEYFTLRKDRNLVRLVFTLFLILLALGTLAGAIWAGLRLASRLVRPITDLVVATNKVSAGDLDVRLDPLDDDEVGVLTQSFNRMTKQLKSSRELLERKNNELDDRRRTMEALFTGVTAGVISMDGFGVVKAANRRARDVLTLKVGQKLEKGEVELGAMVAQLLENTQLELVQQQVRVESTDGEWRTLLVRLVPQRVSGGKIGALVMTFDDVTDLLGAQRLAAWADVAQRLAHEIKNPLTPIQLSAERIKRKYGKQIADESELFEQLIATIVRQTEDMRGMLNEFSSFARMPTAKPELFDFGQLLDEVKLLQGSREQVKIDIEGADGVMLYADRAQVQRVFTNLIQNAVNALLEEENPPAKQKPSIKVVVNRSQGGTVDIELADNGPGLPKEIDVETLFDPYITTRKKGTGLGLAIVRRVMDEHEGTVRLLRRKPRGTRVELSFPAPANEQKKN